MKSSPGSWTGSSCSDLDLDAKEEEEDFHARWAWARPESPMSGCQSAILVLHWEPSFSSTKRIGGALGVAGMGNQDRYHEEMKQASDIARNMHAPSPLVNYTSAKVQVNEEIAHIAIHKHLLPLGIVHIVLAVLPCDARCALFKCLDGTVCPPVSQAAWASDHIYAKHEVRLTSRSLSA